MLAPNSILQNRYRVVRLLSEGGMGSVYEAIDQRVSCVVALKRTAMENSPESQRAFEREAALLANLRHPSLPKVMDYFSEDGAEFLVMEFIPGNDLSELLQLRGGPFPQDQVLKWADDLLQLLEHLHGLQPPILHRDIKPANLKLTKQGEIFLLDFGLAKGAAGQMHTLQTSKSVRGYTPVYSPLEQIHGEGTDARSDVYALGATLYHLLTGRAPTDAPKRFIAIDDNMPDPLPPIRNLNREISEPVAQVIRHAMAIRRRDRFGSATAMRTALRRAVEMDRESDEATREAETARPEEPKYKDQLPGPSENSTSSETIKTVDVSERDKRQAPYPSPKKAEPIKTIRAVYTDIKPPPDLESANEQNAVSDSTPERREVKVPISTSTPEPIKTIKAAYTDVKPGRIQQEPAPRAEHRFRNIILISAALAVVLMGIGLVLLLKSSTKAEEGHPLATSQPTAQSSPNISTTTPPSLPPVPPNGMTFIPGGEFTMGRDDGDEYERPAHHVIVKPFFIDIDEVTNQQYQEFVNKTGHVAPHNWSNKHFPTGQANFPVTDVDWYDAMAYAKWVGKRLPTEEEWEFAARGTDGRLYPWGNSWQAGLANVASVQSSISEVGKYKGTSPYGVLDLIGNVWEWTANRFTSPTSPKGDVHVIRGGNYLTDQNSATTTFRRGYPSRGSYDYGTTGFRCAQGLR